MLCAILEHEYFDAIQGVFKSQMVVDNWKKKTFAFSLNLQQKFSLGKTELCRSVNLLHKELNRSKTSFVNNAYNILTWVSCGVRRRLGSDRYSISKKTLVKYYIEM